jgi:DNA-binding transcriptional MerR regulator
METPLWTLDELGARVALALAVDYDGQLNGRVRNVPDRRTIRYYTTLGLIDRPAEMRGRTALYGMRHLLQLVAIKRLQTRGLALAEIQTRVIGRTDAALRQLAQLPADFEPAGHTKPQTPESPRRERFWNAAPAEVAGSEKPAAVEKLIGVPLTDGATLLLHSPRSLDEHDLSALHVAAAPLLKQLTARRLLAGNEGKSHTKGETS